MAIRCLMMNGLLVMLTSVCMADDAARQLSDSEMLTVAVVQMRSSRDLNENVEKIQTQIRKAAAEGARAVVFPECALSGYFAEWIGSLSAEQLSAAENEVAGVCRSTGVYAIVGTPHREGTKIFNSATVFTPGGKVLLRYHKVQLAAEHWATPGNELSVFKIDGVPASIIICHDERYPELVRLPVLAGAKVVFYISHESELRHEKKIAPYRAQIQARAVENTVYVVQANAPANPDGSGSHGHSRIVAPDGNIVQEASIFEEDMLVSTLDLRRANRANAMNSLVRGPLADWWKQGVARVKIVE